MSFRDILFFLLKVVLLSIIMGVVFAAASAVASPAAAAAADPDAASASLIGIFVVSLVDVLVLAFVILLSSWAGLALMAGLAFSFYGVQTFIGQIEALAFLTPIATELGSGTVPVLAMPVEMIIGFFVVGLVLALTVVPLAVWFFGKARSGAGETRPQLLPRLGAGQWLWKLLVIIVAYELLYFGFGYYVAWQNPAVLAFYQGTDPGNFLAQLGSVAQATPLLFGLQAVRALLWVVFALPVIMMTRHKPWLGALATALFLALPMNIQHIIPNPFMPGPVRLAHFVETASSNFIFGLLLFWLLHRAHHSLQGLAGRPQRVERSRPAEG